MQPFLKRGYNVTMDNYFTRTNSVDKLKAEKTALLGTIKKQKEEIPKVEEMMKGKPLYSSVIYQFSSNPALTIY